MGILLSMLWVRKNNRVDTYQQHSDAALIQLYKETGQEEYVAELFQRYSDKVYIIARKYLNDRDTCKDIVMIVFEKVIKNLKKTDVQTFGNWVHTITRNECNYYHRSQNNKSKRMEEWGEFEKKSHDNVENDPLLHLIREETTTAKNKQLHTALNSLREEHKICIQLFYFEKKSYKEIAEITGFTHNQVKSYIQHGKNNLRNILPEQ